MKTIFIVDDNKTNLAAAQQALVGLYKIMLLLSAAKMFEMLANVVPDLILLDIEMPGMDGLAALMQLKSTPEYSSIPVVMLTAHGQGETVMNCAKSGANGFVVKPFIKDALLESISRAIGE